MLQQTIYLVRHGETEWNREKRLQGQQDSPLTEKGREQARRIGLALRAVVGDPTRCMIVASPLGRTLHTTEILTRALGLEEPEIHTDSRLKEIAFGTWEGMTFDEVAAVDPDTLRRRQVDSWNVASPGGETFTAVERRVKAWLDELPADARAIVVAHGESGRLLRGVYCGLKPAEILALDKPQDAFFRLSQGRITRHETTADI